MFFGYNDRLDLPTYVSAKKWPALRRKRGVERNVWFEAIKLGGGGGDIQMTLIAHFYFDRPLQPN